TPRKLLKIISFTILSPVDNGFHVIPNLDILWTSLDANNVLTISAIVPHGTHTLGLKTFTYPVVDIDSARAWTKQVNTNIYEDDVEPKKRLKVLVNPLGGQGKARSIFETKVRPVFEAAQCVVDVTYTERRYHALDIAKSLDLSAFDTIVTVSGDGLIYEVINGLLERKDAREAMKMPLGVIPAGTGNALSVSMLGEKDGFDPVRAALQVLKGTSMHLDVCSITYDDQRCFSFLSQNYGIAAYADLGTESMRWMGDVRGPLGFLQAIFAGTTYGMTVHLKIAESSKSALKEAYRSGRNHTTTHDTSTEDMTAIHDVHLPPLADAIPDTPEWLTIDDEVKVFLASKVPWVGRGMLTHPCALPGDGLLDVLIVGGEVGKMEMLNVFSKVEKGEHIDSDVVKYYKVHAFRMIPPGKAKLHVHRRRARARQAPSVRGPSASSQRAELVGQVLRNGSVAQRAIYQLRQTSAHDPTALQFMDYMDQYPTYVQAGAFFPDWGFACEEFMGYDEAAEDTHWPNFTRVAAEYIREEYPQPYTPHAQRLLAFLFAIISHNVADIQWHSLGYDDGFIRVMADLNFQRVYNSAHGDADTGGEFVLRHMSPLPYEVETWSVPFQDLREIYKRFGHTLDPVSMKHCVWRGYLGKQVIKKLSQYSWFYSQYAKVTPFLIEQIETFHRGGLLDMSAHTTLCWQNLTRFFHGAFDMRVQHLCEAYDGTIRNGPPVHQGDLPFPWPPARNRTREEEDQVRERVMREMGYGIRMQNHAQGVLELSVVGEPKEQEQTDGVKMLMAREYEGWGGRKGQAGKTSRHVDKPEEMKVDGCKPVTESGINSVVYEISSDYAMLGYALASGDFNNDTFPDLAISAPFYTPASTDTLPVRPHAGAVFIVNGAKDKYAEMERGSKLDIIRHADLMLVGEREKMGRFGFAMSVVDLNCDGVDDLAISAPTRTHSSSPLIQPGAIYVYFGRPGLGLPNLPDIEILLGENENGTSWHRRGGNLTGLGTVLHGVDIDGDGCSDLLVGWPWAALEGYTNGSWSKVRWEVRHQQTGSVLAFFSSSQHRGHVSPLSADWTLNSPANLAYEWFGSSIALSVTHNVLLIGAPGWSTPGETVAVGRVYGYNLTGNDPGQPPERIFDLSGTQNYQQFGREIKTLEGVGEEGVVAIGASAELRHLPPDLSSLLTYLPSLLLSTTPLGYASYIAPWTTTTQWQIGSVRMFSIPNMLVRLSQTQGFFGGPAVTEFLLSDAGLCRGPNAPIRVTVDGGENGARLGSVGWVPGRGQREAEAKLWFSEPFADGESGRLYFTTPQSILSTSNPGKNVNIRIGSQCLSFRAGEKARLGHQVLIADIDGDAKPDLIVSALHAEGNNGERSSGNVVVALQ
ncbi:LOW QUALITY PROTEIN: hypothetical protein BC936DRAFT_145697, partial [Jimgerdemannia flammicorona]